MSPQVLLIVLIGAMVGASAVLLVHALTPREPSRYVRPATFGPQLKRMGTQVPFAAAAGILTLLVTRWPVLAIAIGVLVFFAPALFGGASSEKRAIRRLEGLSAWTESLRDTIAGAVGLEQAIPATAYAASPAIAPQLGLLADRLRVRTPLPLALQRFANDLNDPSADLIIAALMLNAKLRGPGLRDVLTSLASSAREELEMRRRVSAGRASTRRSVQIVMAISVFFVLGLSIFNRDYVAPYSSAIGQLVLLIVILFFAAGFLWMRRLSVFELPERFMFTREMGDGR